MGIIGNYYNLVSNQPAPLQQLLSFGIISTRPPWTSTFIWYQIWHQINQPPWPSTFIGIKSTSPPWTSTFVWYQINQPPFNNYFHLVSYQPDPLEQVHLFGIKFGIKSTSPLDQVHSLVSNQPAPLEQAHSFGIKSTSPPSTVTFIWYHINQTPLNKYIYLVSNLASNQPAPLTKYIHWYQINQPPLNKHIRLVSNQPAPLQQLHSFGIKSTSPPWTSTSISYQINQPPLQQLHSFGIKSTSPPWTSTFIWYQIWHQINQPPWPSTFIGIKSTSPPWTSTFVWYQINQPPFNSYIHLVSNQPAPLEQVHPFRIKSTSPPFNNYIHLVLNLRWELHLGTCTTRTMLRCER